MPTEPTQLHLLVSAARAVLSTDPEISEKRFVTWSETTTDFEFDIESAAKYLHSEGKPIDRDLLESYGDSGSKPLALRRIGKIAPWLKPLKEPLGNQGSFQSLRETGEYEGIITFSTPAISEDGLHAFLEVWTESGKNSHMGMWHWVLLEGKESGWRLVWKCLTAMS